MTYNFDPDRWYDDRRRLLELRRQEGTLDEAAFEEAASDLERRYEAMLARLDGTYHLESAAPGQPHAAGRGQLTRPLGGNDER